MANGPFGAAGSGSIVGSFYVDGDGKMTYWVDTVAGIDPVTGLAGSTERDVVADAVTDIEVDVKPDCRFTVTFSVGTPGGPLEIVNTGVLASGGREGWFGRLTPGNLIAMVPFKRADDDVDKLSDLLKRVASRVGIPVSLSR